MDGDYTKVTDDVFTVDAVVSQAFSVDQLKYDISVLQAQIDAKQALLDSAAKVSVTGTVQPDPIAADTSNAISG